MYCTNCGEKIDDNMRFCTYCGAPVEKNDDALQKEEAKNATSQSLSSGAETGKIPPVYTSQTAQKEKKSKKGLIAIIIIVVVAVLAGIGAAANHSFSEKSAAVSVPEVAKDVEESNTDAGVKKITVDSAAKVEAADETTEPAATESSNKKSGSSSAVNTSLFDTTKYGGLYENNTLYYGPVMIKNIPGDYVLDDDGLANTSDLENLSYIYVAVDQWDQDLSTLTAEDASAWLAEQTGEEVTSMFFEVREVGGYPLILHEEKTYAPNAGQTAYLVEACILEDATSGKAVQIYAMSLSKSAAQKVLNLFSAVELTDRTLTAADTGVSNDDGVISGGN